MASSVPKIAARLRQHYRAPAMLGGRACPIVNGSSCIAAEGVSFIHAGFRAATDLTGLAGESEFTNHEIRH
jgi:hypothetical protein